MMRIPVRLAVAAVCLALSLRTVAGAEIAIDAGNPGIHVSPTLYGIFFEEINRAGEGGIYAELVQNRSFEDAAEPAAWSLVADEGVDAGIALDRGMPLNPVNPTSLRIDVRGEGRAGAANSGFNGIGIEEGNAYRLSVYARRGAAFGGTLRVSLESADGTVLAEEKALRGVGLAWQKVETRLVAKGTDPAARLVVRADGPGTVWLDMVSLFPEDTYKGRPGGFRKDLMEMLSAMHPAFVRFPGGCYVEGDRLANAFRWKQTIGDVAERPGHWNLWGYRSSDGLGYHEYLQLCEDLDAEALFVINCGMAHGDHVPMDRMGEYVQDAIDAIEYANGSTDTPWGARRAANGHPKPFNLTMIQIGNENGGPLYNERYALFYDAIKAAYPDIRIVANQWGGVPESRPLEIIDEHYYNTPDFFIGQSRRYDSYERGGPSIYVGEYACTRDCGQGNLRAAVGEAAFMTGMERNSDVVTMASYAPLFCNPGWKRWNPNAINFDAARVYGTPSYHVQCMFGANRPDRVLPVEITATVKPAAGRPGRIGLATWDTQAEFKDVVVTKDGKTLFASDFAKGLDGWTVDSGRWSVADGLLRQAASDEPAVIVAGDPAWSDYTLAVKARKTGGSEGFLIMFQVQDAKEKSWWNLGGWQNREHGVEAPNVSEPRTRGAIETGRWYDIRIELQGPAIRCYLDGKLVQEAFRGPDGRPLHASAGVVEKDGSLIIKVANVSDEEQTTAINITGLKRVLKSGTATVLKGESGAAENSFEAPEAVVPATNPLRVSGTSLTYPFPPQSVTVIRLQTGRR